MAQEVHANSSDNESVQSSEDEEQKEFDNLVTTELFNLLSTKAETQTCGQKVTKQTSKLDAQKQANLPPEIFDYIHTAKCWRHFVLAWYDD